MRALFNVIFHLLIGLFFFGCVTVKKTPSVDAVLTINDGSFNLTRDTTTYREAPVQIWLQVTEFKTPVEKLIQKRRDSFLLYFRDDVDPYSNRNFSYSNCLVDTNHPDRVVFYFGGEKTWHECLDKILPKKAIRIWTICENSLFEVTATPVTEKDKVSLTCIAEKK